MVELNDMEKQLLTELAKDPLSLEAFMKDYKQKISDLRLIKDTVNHLMTHIGLRNEDGTFRQNISMNKIFEVAMRATTHPKQFKKEMAFIGDIMPLIEKYKDL